MPYPAEVSLQSVTGANVYVVQTEPDFMTIRLVSLSVRVLFNVRFSKRLQWQTKQTNGFVKPFALKTDGPMASKL